jgi:hypothetical protein
MENFCTCDKTSSFFSSSVTDFTFLKQFELGNNRFMTPSESSYKRPPAPQRNNQGHNAMSS